MSGNNDDDDLLAAEYVLGVLDPAEAAAVALRLPAEPALADAVSAWQRRLLPLSTLVEPAPVPGAVWTRIEESIERRPGAVVRVWRSAGLWRGTTAAALALAAAFAGIAYLRPPPPPVPEAVATLSPAGAPSSVFLAQAMADGTIVVRPISAVSVAAGHDLELWALPAGAAKPVSLGVLPAGGRRVPATPPMARPDTQLMVSLEPPGGSPTGAPTGPVVYAGRLASTD